MKCANGVCRHALSVDVEDWTTVQLLVTTGKVVPPTEAVVRNTEKLLSLFLKHGATATWFVLGEVAAKYPALVRMLSDAKQELGVHGYHHHYLYDLSQQQFRDGIARAKAIIEDLSGKPVYGFRACTFSIQEGNRWVFEVLAQSGFVYDSSIFPFQGSRYGAKDSPLVPYDIFTDHGRIREIPLSIAEVMGRRIPCCGGGYFRHFPLLYTRFLLRRIERAGRTAVFYFHPHEVDPEYNADFFEKEMPVESRTFKFRVYRHLQHRNRSLTLHKLESILRHRTFGGIREVFGIDNPVELATNAHSFCIPPLSA